MSKPRCTFLLSLLILFSTAHADSLRFATTTPGQAGVAEALLTEAYKRIDLSISAHYLPSSRSLRAANSGTLDGELFRVDLRDNAYGNLIQVPVELFSIEIFVVTNKTIDGDKIENFKDMQFAAISGLIFIESLIERYQLRELIRVGSFDQQMGLFITKKVDAIFATPAMAEAIVKTYPNSDFRVIPTHESVPLYHYLHKKHAELVPLITQSLNEMKTSGELDKIAKLHYAQREADLVSRIKNETK